VCRFLGLDKTALLLYSNEDSVCLDLLGFCGLELFCFLSDLFLE
jgi:hypothetical protein